MGVSLELVKQLRDRTSAGMMACQKALEESGGDIDGAIDILRKKGEAKADARAERSTQEGRIAVCGKAIVKLLCETDFVAKNENFLSLLSELATLTHEKGIEEAFAHFESVRPEFMQSMGENMSFEAKIVSSDGIVGSYVHSNLKLGAIVVLQGGTEEQAKDIAMHAVAMNPLCANPEDIDSAVLEREKSIYREQLKAEGKPENIVEKIMEGKVKKFCADNALTSQAFVKDPSLTVQQYLGDAKLLEFIRMAV